MKQLQRLLVQQGHKCFFCGGPIPAGEASVEHLDAVSNGGEKTDQNCVACCRAINTALGNLSVKDKIRAILSQPSPFPCPHQSLVEDLQAQPLKDPQDLIAKTLDILRRHGDKPPRRKNTLFNAIKVEVPELTEDQFAKLLDALLSQGVAAMVGAKVTYPALEGEA